MQEVRIPHTVKELPFNYCSEKSYQMVSGYRRFIDASNLWKDKTILLTFEGVAHQAEVYLNGEKIAEHNCGYTSFTVDITDSLMLGWKNVLVVKCNSMENLNVPPFGFVIDYMTYGGIYRDVYLDIKDKS